MRLYRKIIEYYNEEQEKIFFHNSQSVCSESIRQLEAIKQIANEYKFNINAFNTKNYGFEEPEAFIIKNTTEFNSLKFKNFINEIKQQTSSEIAYTFAFSLIDGSSKWGEVLSDLNILKLIKNRCSDAWLKNKDKNKTVADIVWLELRKLNSHKSEWKIYDSANRTLGGLLRRVRRGVKQGKETLADCKPLTILFYLTMLSLGQETNLHLTDIKENNGKWGKHMYSGVIINGKEVIYENTATKYDERHITKSSKYNDKIADIWSILAEEIAINLDIENQEDGPILMFSKAESLEQIRIIFDEKNTFVLSNLIKLYKSINKYLNNNTEEFQKRYLNRLVDYGLVFYEGYLKVSDKDNEEKNLFLERLEKIKKALKDICDDYKGSNIDLLDVKNLISKLEAISNK